MTTSAPQLSIKTFLNPFELYSDSRGHGYQGSSRNVRLGRVTPPGGGSIAKSEDGMRCAVTGKESLRILRVSEPSESNNPDHKFSVGRGGHRIDASRNFWDTSGLKIDSASTDVAWGHGQFNNKILTSARNGELILWDLNKSGVTKYERRTKDHIRSIHKMSVSHVVHHYCITGSADGHMRVWDIRDLSKSIMRVHHPTSVRSLVFSPSLWQPLQAIAGLDNGSIYRWDLRMGQRGLLDKLPVAHTASVTALDWCSAAGAGPQGTSAVGITGQGDPGSTGLGWLVSGGLDRCVKVWDLTSPGASTHIPHKPTYTLHPSFAVRRLAWRPGYECEIAVVSTTEFATSSVDSSNAGSSGLLTRTGSGHGLDHIMRGALPESIYPSKDKMGVQTDVKASSSIPSVGDAVEIWDARRGWLAKWSVRGSAVEGGVTDITFGDSHAIWAQHTSGSFSQIDLRDATKPIDAIPRVATTWEATGSMAFVVDKADRWEVPYDDIHPERKNVVDLPKPSTKALGDPTFKQSTQTIGTFSDFTDTDLETFTTLARRYLFEGRTRKDICAYNAGVAFGAGHEAAAQIWLLLGASLAEYIPAHPPTPPPSPPTIPTDPPAPTTQLSPSISTNLTGYSFPTSSTNKSAELSPSIPQRISPARRSTSGSLSRVSSHTPSSSTSRRLTPTSSTSSSPRHIPLSLPPVTPRRASFFGRRESIDSSSVPHPSMLRRPSIPPSLAITASSPGDRSTPSLRHVGEGVLDDSDSSGSEEDPEGEETAAANSSDGEGVNTSRSEQTQTAPRNIPTPSPLSRIAGHQAWTEDEDDGGTDHEDDAYSPSPQSSTDSDSHGSSSPDTRSKSVKATRRGSNHYKSRSRSSTVASLAAPPPRPLSRQNSRSSIRTVTGPDAPARDQEDSNSVHRQGPPVNPAQDPKTGHHRHKSTTVSEMIANSTKPSTPAVRVVDIPAQTDVDIQMTERRIEIIKLDDNRFKATTLKALERALEQFAEEGDVQMCAMLALVAPEELHIPRSRVRRFLDSYIAKHRTEILTRLRLHTCAAYLRKYCDHEDIRKPTLMGTTIYTSCGKCRKPLLVPAGSFSGRVINQGAFSFCLGCKSSVVMCSICRLPVRALLFQCSVCHHGGHQACYRQYYLQQPMVDLPSSFVPASDSSRGRASVRIASTSVEDDAGSTADTSGIPSPEQPHHPKSLAGHPCAAGCGHFCWAANKEWEELP
ncbi:GATOR complex protein WDR24 [Psilocybe cubensis]|uniref:GATOR complex protein WDR24 n=2 Tax=Psilocybe cubensis TaxID=181762 RepID=A0ACB8H251_PSICU|nr:GATOR complex protein WDR24 [Psilocybe cubensis]KAH9481800.1 GATOR complex protein WDR24 [Psilocybe cubensis]